MVSCGMKVIRYLLFAFNLIFAISGLVILGVGATTLAYHNGVHLLVNNIWWIPAIFITVGSVIFIISSLGCCGAVHSNNIMMKSFALLLIVILLLELVVGVVAFMLRSEGETFLYETLSSSLRNYSTSKSVQEGWNILQLDFTCCGVNGPADYKKLFQNDTLPGTCCPDNAVGDVCTIDVDHSTHGCFDTLKDIITSKAIIILSSVVGVIIVQLIGVILACFLARAFRVDYETV